MKQFRSIACSKGLLQEDNSAPHPTSPEEKPFVCSVCNKGFSRKHNLKDHLRIHTGEKPYVCSVCNKGFYQGSYLKVHLRSHTGEKPFICSVCDKRFSRVQSFKRHLRTHNGQEPYVCMCNKRFLKQSDFKIHLCTHTGEKPEEEMKFSCGICDKLFKHTGSVYQHMRKFHNVEPSLVNSRNVTCPDPECTSSFHYRDQLRTHIINDHNINLEVEERTFPTYKAFSLWKETVEKEMKSSYVKTQASKYTGGKKVDYFFCHRTGFFSSVAKVRIKRKKDSKKISGHCPSSMDVSRRLNENEVKVTFWKTHFGHECDINHLRLTKEEKIIIADKIRKGIPRKQIIAEARCSVNGSERYLLLKGQDVRNINRDLKQYEHEELPSENTEIMDFMVPAMDQPVPTTKNVTLKQKLDRVKQFLDEELTEEESEYIDEAFNNVISFFNQSKDERCKSVETKKARSKPFPKNNLFQIRAPTTEEMECIKALLLANKEKLVISTEK